MGKPRIDESVTNSTRWPIGAQIREIRLSRGLTQRDLGVLIGYGQQEASARNMVSTLERGPCNMTLASLQRVADALGATLCVSIEEDRHAEGERE